MTLHLRRRVLCAVLALTSAVCLSGSLITSAESEPPPEAASSSTAPLEESTSAPKPEEAPPDGPEPAPEPEEAPPDEPGADDSFQQEGADMPVTEPPAGLEELKAQFLLLLALPEDETAALDEKLSRLILLGDADGSLRAYLEAQIEKYVLAARLAALQAIIDAAAAEGALSEIETAAALSEDTPPPGALLSAIGEVSESAAGLLENVGFEENPDLYMAAVTAWNRMQKGDGTDSQVAAALLFQALLDSEVLTEAGRQTAQNGIRDCFAAVVRTRPAPGDGLLLDAASSRYGETFEKAEFMAAESLIVAAAPDFQLTAPVFRYGGNVMLSLADSAALLDGEILETGSQTTLALEGDGFLLEAVLGESDGYLNDRLLKLSGPVLYLDNTCYLPLSAVAACGGYGILENDGETLIYDLKMLEG